MYIFWMWAMNGLSEW